MVVSRVSRQALLASCEKQEDFGERKEFMTRERMRELQRNWKDRRKAQGFCHNCWTAKAGEDNGSRTLCGTCRRRKQRREEARRRAAGMLIRQEWLMMVRNYELPKGKRSKHTALKPREEDTSLPKITLKTRELLRLSALLKKSSVNPYELRRQAVC